MSAKPYILPTIIVAQFACTSLWFSGNVIIDGLAQKTQLGPEIIGYVLSSVQLGFISGTLVFAFLMLPDRFRPSNVFLYCAVLGAICNAMLLWDGISKQLLLGIRFATGFFLAGIYPVGMKIAADYYEKGLGRALGYLVGALVMGTAAPYLIKAMSWGTNDTAVIMVTSSLAILGGLCLWILVPEGPFRRPSSKLQLTTGPQLFKSRMFRKAAFGYFGHMWELYAFWAFTPFALKSINQLHAAEYPIALGTFLVIFSGGFSCILGGMLSQRFGSKKVAATSLSISGLLCVLSPTFFLLPPVFFLGLWCFWGMMVTADSPQFSAMVAAHAPPENKGTALTLVNCIGFAISIGSIQLLSYLSISVPPQFVFMVLAIGPLIGISLLSQKSP